MAICELCNQDMTKADGCVAHLIVYGDGTKIPAWAFGKEPYVANSTRRCHDCNAAPGEYHHPGCDVERCPNCGGQLISCPCGSVSAMVSAVVAPATPPDTKGASAEFPPTPVSGIAMATNIDVPGVGLCDLWIVEDIGQAEATPIDPRWTRIITLHSSKLSDLVFSRGLFVKGQYITETRRQVLVQNDPVQIQFWRDLLKMIALRDAR